MLLQPLINIAEICSQKNINTVILSAGSRNALLTIAFVRHPQIKTYTISDERTAAFIALGMAQQKLADYLQQPSEDVLSHSPLAGVALVCTSGTASLNYYPAIAEAYYQQIPLVIFTADRPPEWIDQQDGQTIRQRNIYEAHIKKSYELPVNLSHQADVSYTERIVNEAINTAFTPYYAPVHINVPIREPFYPQKDEQISFDKQVRNIAVVPTERKIATQVFNQLLDIWDDNPKKLLVIGQAIFEPSLHKVLNQLSQELQIPVVVDIMSNYQSVEGAITMQDTILLQEQANLMPDLLITFGKSLISKSLKQFLRKSKPVHHWHIQEEGYVPDTFQTLTHHIPANPLYFLGQLFSEIDYLQFVEQNDDTDTSYMEDWQKAEQKAQRYLHQFISQHTNAALSDFIAVATLLHQLPENVVLHIANSMPIRYANYVGLKYAPFTEIFANRGTSGIDGCTSTAIGAALANPNKTHVLITGDVGFFYDRNAFWHNYLPSNLKIVLLNNGGGNIFRLIDAANLPELEEYFETHQKLNARLLAKEFGLQYMPINDWQTFTESLPTFWQSNTQPPLMEIFTDKKYNAQVLEKFKLQA